MSRGFSGLVAGLRPYATELVRIAAVNRLMPRVTSVRRSRAQQGRLWRRAQQGLSEFPAALPGTSEHERGYAFDLVLADNSYLKDLGEIWEGWGGVWGGHYNDPIHFGVFKPQRTDRSALDQYCALAEAHPYLSLAAGFIPYVGWGLLGADVACYVRSR